MSAVKLWLVQHGGGDVNTVIIYLKKLTYIFSPLYLSINSA